MNVRSFPTTSLSTDFGGGSPATSGIQPVLKSGYIGAKVQSGTADKGGKVFTRVSATTSTKFLGGLEAVADAAVSNAAGTNTGTGPVGTASATSSALAGDYKVVFSAATKFDVSDPNGDELKSGVTGTAYTANGLTFTITARGTAFVATDSFTVSVTQNTIEVPKAYFANEADSDSNVEVAFNI